jgi:hypothetical protein
MTALASLTFGGARSMIRQVRFTLLVAFGVWPGSDPILAEPVAGSDSMLCTAQQISVCAPFEECRSGLPVEWNLPDFVVVDVAAKTLSTTAANQRPRASTIPHLQRDQGVLSVCLEAQKHMVKY